MNPEGHDDAPQTGDNNSVKPTQSEPQAPQGIFSSGDLAVHSENLDAIKPELSDENKSRIASAFAQTDATQKHDQLADQMAEQDAVSGDVIPAGGIGSASGAGFGSNAAAASASGDIRLPGGKKKSKLPFVFAVLVLLAVIGGVAAFFVLRNISEQTGTEASLTLFRDYLSYAENGPQNSDSSPNPDDANSPEDTNVPSEEDTESAWYFNSLPSQGLTLDEVENYISELNARFDNFANKNSSTDLLKGIAVHKELLTVLEDYYTLDIIYNYVVDKYLSEGYVMAQAYINERIGVSPDQSDEEDKGAVETAKNLEHDYLYAKLDVLRDYRAQGCIINNEVDASCVLDISDEQTLANEQNAIELRESLANFAPLLERRYRSSANAILNNLEQK